MLFNHFKSNSFDSEWCDKILSNSKSAFHPNADLHWLTKLQDTFSLDNMHLIYRALNDEHATLTITGDIPSNQVFPYPYPSSILFRVEDADDSEVEEDIIDHIYRRSSSSEFLVDMYEETLAFSLSGTTKLKRNWMLLLAAHTLEITWPSQEQLFHLNIRHGLMNYHSRTPLQKEDPPKFHFEAEFVDLQTQISNYYFGKHLVSQFSIASPDKILQIRKMKGDVSYFDEQKLLHIEYMIKMKAVD